jgi:thioredoxin reductase (NADPH)
VEEISGKELYKIGIEQAKRIGVEIIEDEVVQISNEKNFKVTTINAEYDATNVILATGINRKESTIKGIKEYEGKGISYCAVCDAFFFRGKDVAVIGDGNYAVHEAEILKPIAKSVRIITNGKSMVQNRNIDVETIKDSVKEVKGKDILEEIEFANGKTIKIDGVFVAEGIATSTDLAKRIGALVEGNNIKINENMETSVRGLYACGDCTGGILQISKAVYEGAKAGLEIIKKEDKNVSN